MYVFQPMYEFLAEAIFYILHSTSYEYQTTSYQVEL